MLAACGFPSLDLMALCVSRGTPGLDEDKCHPGCLCKESCPLWAPASWLRHLGRALGQSRMGPSTTDAARPVGSFIRQLCTAGCWALWQARGTQQTKPSPSPREGPDKTQD